MTDEEKQKSIKFPGVCGCGQPNRYYVSVSPETMACNKYMRCPTYEDLRQQVAHLTDCFRNEKFVCARCGSKDLMVGEASNGASKE